MSHDTTGRRSTVPGPTGPRRLRLGTAGLGLGQLFALIFGFLITSALIFLFGIWVGRDITERRLAREERAVRMPVPEQPTPEAPKTSEVDLAFFETLKQRAEQRLRQTEVATASTPTPAAAAAAPTAARPVTPPAATRPAAPAATTRPATPPTPKPTPRPVTPRPTAAAGPTHTPRRAASDAGGEWADAGWTVQVSATIDAEQAAALTARLKSQGYDAYTVASPLRGQLLHRVRVGRYDARDKAQEVEARLKREGYTNAYVTPR